MAQQVVNVSVLACVYALFALGFNIVLGALDILNLVQGVLLTIGAYIGVIATGQQVPLAGAFILAFIGGAAANVLVGEGIVRPVRRRRGGNLSVLVATLGASVIAETAIEQISGAQISRIQVSSVPAAVYRWQGVAITEVDLMVIASAIVLLVGSWLFLRRTKTGLVIRAVQFSERAALTLGLPVDKAIRRAFFVSGGFAGLAGVLVALLYQSVQYAEGDPYLLLGFVIVVIGGFGSVAGTVLGSFVVAAIETASVYIGYSGLSDGIALGAMLLVLLIRPQGLFMAGESHRA